MMDDVGRRIKARRLELELTQEELAKRVGYKSKSSINKIETEYNVVPAKMIAKFANALRCTPEYLLNLEELHTSNRLLNNEVALRDAQLLNKLSELDDENYNRIMDLINIILENQKLKNNISMSEHPQSTTF